jgi:hypothetical protein
LKERIICAAIHYQDDKPHERQASNIKTGLVIAGLRHGNCFITLEELVPDPDSSKLKAGFITSEDRFVDRKEAYKIAFNAEQIINQYTRVEPNEYTRLHSEDIY